MTVPTVTGSLSSRAQAQHPVSDPGQAQPAPVVAQDESHQVKSAQAEAHRLQQCLKRFPAVPAIMPHCNAPSKGPGTSSPAWGTQTFL